MGRSCLRFYLAVFLISRSLAGVAQQPLHLSDNKKFYGHSNTFLFLKDDERKYSSADFYLPVFTEGFKPAGPKQFNFGLTSAAIWYHFVLVNETGDRWLLKAENPTVQEVTLYIPRRSGTCDSVHLSLLQKIGERPWRNNHYLITLPFPDSVVQDYYLRITSDHSMTIPPQIGTVDSFFVANHYADVWAGIYLGLILIMAVYNLFIFISIRDNSYLWYVLYILCIGFLVSTHNSYPFDLFWPDHPWLNTYIDLLTSGAGVFAILFTMNFLQTKTLAPRIHKGLHVVMWFYIAAAVLVAARFTLAASIAEAIVGFIGSIYVFWAVIYIYRTGFQPARYYLLAWGALMISVLIFVLFDIGIFDLKGTQFDPLLIGSSAEALLLSFALADRYNTYKKEKEDLISKQNIILEQKVEERTHALKQTQHQLVQQEKMASLGQMTKSIGHEIQNPLSFVSNFSELSKNLIEELGKGMTDERQQQILTNLQSNFDKVIQHSRRASGIVKSMMEHNRSGSDEKQLTDMNRLCEEYSLLAYQSIRSMNRGFRCELQKDFQHNLPEVFASAQDLGRAITNLLKNAFEAVYQRSIKEKAGADFYRPEVFLSTLQKNKSVFISIRDNGTGIPESLAEKIFLPFFTTHERGEGAGLGLSIAYEIIKAHGGELTVTSKENAFTEFVITLPL
jgi:two-component system NtrC family sensor kinase